MMAAAVFLMRAPHIAHAVKMQIIKKHRYKIPVLFVVTLRRIELLIPP